MGQGNEDVHGLGEYFVALVLRHELYGAAVVKPVGELDQHDAYVVVEREQNALEVLRLETFGADRGTLPVLVVEHRLDLRETVDQGGYLVAEQAAYVVHRVACVLHDIVQQRGADGLVAEADFAHDNLGHFDRMEDVRLARAPADVLVRLVGEFEGFLHTVDLLLVPAAAPRDFEQGGVGLVDDLVIVSGEF